jgi:hypothetical protein
MVMFVCGDKQGRGRGRAGQTRKGKYGKIILKEKKIPKMNKPNKE